MKKKTMKNLAKKRAKKKAVTKKKIAKKKVVLKEKKKMVAKKTSAKKTFSKTAKAGQTRPVKLRTGKSKDTTGAFSKTSATKARARVVGRTQKISKVNIPKKSNIKSVATIICSHLSAMGFDPVLTGKACAAIYSEGLVDSKSLDFVISEYLVDRIEAVMRSLGFTCLVHRTFGNKALEYEVSFMPPPVVVGDAMVENIHLFKSGKGELRMLNPTDCVRQRLSMYYRFGSESALKDAIAVASKNEVDMNLVERWSGWEWAGDKFEIFKKMLGMGQ